MSCITEYFANSFFRYTIKEWNNLNAEIRKSVSYEVFKNSLLKFIRPSPNSLFNESDNLGIKLLTRLRIGLSHLREHKFNHNFQHTINPLHRFFYKNHQAQNCQKIKNILRIMARLKYMINNLESPILILHQESAIFTMECLLFTMESLQFRKTCVRNQHTNQSKHS